MSIPINRPKILNFNKGGIFLFYIIPLQTLEIPLMVLAILYGNEVHMVENIPTGRGLSPD